MICMVCRKTIHVQIHKGTRICSRDCERIRDESPEWRHWREDEARMTAEGAPDDEQDRP